MPEKFGPCKKLNCSWCCDPVKIGPRSKHAPNELVIPKDKNDEDIWVRRNEEWRPEADHETLVVDTYDCKKFNRETGLCDDYANRPEICKNTSCVSEKLESSEEEQRKKFVESEFYCIKK